MHDINQITEKHIEQLSDRQLSQVLHALIRAEAKMNDLEGWEAFVPFNINSQDEGEDGRITWTGEPPNTEWFKNRYTIFQNKATKLTPSKCYQELVRSSKNGKIILKASIIDTINKNGCYTLFYKYALGKSAKTLRIDQFRSAVKDAGVSGSKNIRFEIFDANDIKDWVNSYLSVVTLVQSFIGISRPASFVKWDEWGRDINDTHVPFQSNDLLIGYIEMIRSSIISKKVIRISGHSGIGKTRMVFEAFRAPANNDTGKYDSTKALQELMVYYNLGSTGSIVELSNFITSHRAVMRGIIVVDECDASNHKELSRLVLSQGNLKIITIGTEQDREIEDPTIRLDRNMQRDVVHNIVEDLLADTHMESDRQYIEHLSEGYPWMAVKFCDIVRKEGMTSLHHYPIKTFIKKLMFGPNDDDFDQEAYDIIQCCALFSSFGFIEESIRKLIDPSTIGYLQKQMDFIRKTVYDVSISEKKFRKVCKIFLDKDIIERKGTRYVVKPNVLAIQLAAEWLQTAGITHIRTVIEQLNSVDLHANFFERLKDLDQIDEAKNIVEELTKDANFFANAEVIKSSWGSHLFRYIVEVNPIASLLVLEKHFNQMGKEQLVTIKEARRNLIWSLEKLVFRNETFDGAAKLLYRFSVAENEQWSNNATNQFLQLFHIYLPGTMASLADRLLVIKWGLDQHDDDFTNIAIQAMAAGLNSDRFMRMGGAEHQGSGAPLKDYIPEKWDEIFTYWKQLIEWLTHIALQHEKYSSHCKTFIAHSIRGLSRIGKLELIETAVREIAQHSSEVWLDAIEALKQALHYDIRYNKPQQSAIRLLIDDLTPKNDIHAQLLVNVIKPSWLFGAKDSENHTLEVTNKAKAYADELCAHEIDWKEYLTDLLSGEQRQTFHFGVRLGEIISDRQQFLQQAMASLRLISPAEQSPELIAGFLHGMPDKTLAKTFFTQFLDDPLIRRHCFFIIRFINPNFEDIQKLFLLVERDGLHINAFKQLLFGGTIRNLNEEEFKQLCDRICTYGKMGPWTALALLDSYIYQNEEKWIKLKEYAKLLISRQNMALDVNGLDQLEAYHWSEMIKRILRERDEPDFALIITQQLIDFLSQENFYYGMDDEIHGIFAVMLDRYFTISWPLIGQAIIERNYLFFMHVESHLGKQNGLDYRNQDLLFNHPEYYPLLIDWCKQNGTIAQQRMAKMMPLTDRSQPDLIVWHPFSKLFLDQFGHDGNVILNLSANMGTFSFGGSTIPYYRCMQQLMQELFDHSISSLNKWARQKYDELEKDIRLEEIRNEEDQLRR
jgi:hypothetical protein